MHASFSPPNGLQGSPRSRCPGFIPPLLAGAQRTCRELGGKLVILARDTVVLAGARGGVKPLERRQARTDVVILGPMRGTPYDYVSPRNACESGFVEQSVLKKLNPR